MESGSKALVLSAMENLGLSVARGLGARGMAPAVLGAGAGLSLRLSRHCSAYVRASEADFARASEELVERARRLCEEHGLSLVVPADVSGTLIALRLRERLPHARFFPMPSAELLRRFDDKWSFYRFLVENGLPTPRTERIERLDDVSRLGLAWPVFVKPQADSGGRGVFPSASEAELRARLSAPEAYPRPPFLVQEAVPGRDVDVSFLADRGRLVCWAVQRRDAEGQLEFIRDERVADLARRMALASGYTGLAHVDLRSDERDGSVKVIECNPRFWGTFQYSAALGADFLGQGLALAWGQESPSAAESPEGFCPGLRWTLRRLASGCFDVPPATRAYLRQKLGDPGPELYKAFKVLLRRG